MGPHRNNHLIMGYDVFAHKQNMNNDKLEMINEKFDIPDTFRPNIQLKL